MGTTMMNNGKLTAAGRAELAKGKKRSSSKKAKLTPAVRHLRFELTTSGTPDTETSHYIDLAQALSKVNRRMYRQGRDYHVKKISIVSSNTPNGGNRLSAATMGEGWVSQQAWKRAFQVFSQMNKEATENVSGRIAGTWADFKVWLSYEMQTGNILQPLDNGGNNYNTGDWDYSQLVTPDGTTGADPFYVHMMGDHQGSAGAWTSVGLIKSYGESRATVQTTDPNIPGTVSDDPLVNVFDYGTTVDEVVDRLEGNNDAPPYGVFNYPGDDANGPKPIVMQDTTIVDGRAVVGGFTARCGLIELEAKSSLPNDTISVLIELSPGSYRGIKADVI